MSLLVRDRAALVVVDVQEGFRSYPVFAPVADSCAKPWRRRASSRFPGS